jgi:hypothetical protein
MQKKRGICNPLNINNQRQQNYEDKDQGQGSRTRIKDKDQGQGSRTKIKDKDQGHKHTVRIKQDHISFLIFILYVITGFNEAITSIKP